MTLGVSDLQSDSELDSIRNSCDVYSKRSFPRVDYVDQRMSLKLLWKVEETWAHDNMTGGGGNIENTLRWNQVRKGGFRREKRSVGGRGRHLKQITFVLETLRTLKVNEMKMWKSCFVINRRPCLSDSLQLSEVSLQNTFTESEHCKKHSNN